MPKNFSQMPPCHLANILGLNARHISQKRLFAKNYLAHCSFIHPEQRQCRLRQRQPQTKTQPMPMPTLTHAHAMATISHN